MFDAQHTAYKHWRTFGQELIQEHDEGRQMKGIVAVSAHWESDRPGVIEVNTDAGNPMVYDYYGFPDDYVRSSRCSALEEEKGADARFARSD
jgi:4,5-DOPA dioxygenase extradiol